MANREHEDDEMEEAPVRQKQPWSRRKKQVVWGSVAGVAAVAMLTIAIVAIVSTVTDFMDEVRSIRHHTGSAYAQVRDGVDYAKNQVAARKKAGEAAVARRQARLKTAEEYAALFGPEPKEARWAVELRTGAAAKPAEQLSLFGRVCDEVDKFWAMDRALRAMKPGGGSGITWQELGLDKAAAEKMYWNAGVTASRSLFGTFQVPRVDRVDLSCQMLKFAQPLTVGEEIISILAAMGADPRHMGLQSSGQLRQWVVHALRADIAEVRKEGPEQLAAFLAPIKKGETGWKFAAAELTLTADEAKLIEPERLQPKEGKKQG